MDYVIIGNGVAGTTAAENIRKIDNKGTISIISDEGFPFYSRIKLIDFLSDSVNQQELLMKRNDWYKENRIDLVLNSSVTDIDSEKKEIIMSSGNRMRYDRLLLATGGVSFIPPLPGASKEGVFALRTLKDALAIKEYVKKGNNNVIVIGGGVLGLEAGYNLIKAGGTVTVVEFFPRLLPRQMDPEGAEMLKLHMEKMGFQFHLGVTTQEITGGHNTDGIILDNGTPLACDMILVSAGVRPNAALAKKLGLTVKKGVTVNDRMETELADIYAAGDLIEHRGIFYGIWPASDKQGEVAGINMAGGNAAYEGTAISNILKVAGISLAAAGEIDPENKYESIVLKDTENFIYKKLVINDRVIIGAILYGDMKHMLKIFKAIETKKDISSMRRALEQWDLDDL